MNEPTAIDDPASIRDAPPADEVRQPEPDPLGALEARVRRLEETVVELPDAEQIEERVLERLVDRISREPPHLDMHRPLLPVSVETVRVETNQHAPAEAAPEPVDLSPPPAEAPSIPVAAVAPQAPVAQIAPVAAFAAATPLAAVAPEPKEPEEERPSLGRFARFRQLLFSGTGWFLFDTYAEFRCMWRMFLDPRYKPTRWARLVAIVLLAAILTSYLWMPGIYYIRMVSETLATVVVKVVDLLLAFFLYKVLSREARRYRETAPDLPATLRL